MDCEIRTSEHGTHCENRIPSWQPAFLSPKNSVSITFDHISYNVRSGFGGRSKRVEVLKDVSGDIPPGQLTAIMGPSGAGKSSLLNILAGFTTRGVNGTIHINGEVQKLHNLSHYSCYIMQDDRLQPLLTPREAMHFAARLKLGQISESTKMQIDNILESLKLTGAATTQTDVLSGGERKRLAIGLELIKNPPVMFFDEPTSCLDSSSSMQCIAILKMLAQGGRTIICSIHQPSARLFNQFDSLYALANGQCLYQGSIKKVIPFLSMRNFNCPEYHNPADFLLEVLAGVHGPTLSLMGNNTMKEDKSVTSGTLNNRNISFSKYEKINSTESSSEGFNQLYNTHTPFSLQLKVLIQRNFLLHLRDPFVIASRICIHALVGLFIGLLYYNIGNDAAYVRDNFGFLYFCIMFIQFTAFSSKISNFPLEFPVLTREYFNGWYSLLSYLLAGVAADIPVQVLCTLSYTLLAYFFTSQPAEFHRFFLFFMVCLLVGLVSQSLGVITGVCMDIKNGMVFGPLAVLPFVIFSGFFLSIKDASWYIEWLFHMSYLKYALEAVMQAMYSYGRKKLPCSATYCHYKLPMKLLEELGMVDAKYWVDVTVLSILYLFFMALTYAALNLKLGRR